MSAGSHHEHIDQIRSAGEVARRCIVLYVALAGGHGEPREQLVAWLHHEGLWNTASPRESEFLLSASPTRQQHVNATWRAEALFTLLWSLGLIAELPAPQQLCDVQLIRRVLPPLFGSAEEFISTAQLRSASEILAASEGIYQIHWRVRDAQLRSQPILPGKLPRMPHEDCDPPAESYNSGVVQERHHALNWLIGYLGQEWDDITTDT
ncbi:MAG TPA: DUF4272 domain-containing protein [Chthoniobacter sp.]|nr:DUF4272 domain-containing protein [Chthoniobacter sp.]